MAAIAVREVSKHFGSFTALDRVSIDFPDGGFYALLGPSGSGKTTLLRIIAGFEFPDSGHVTVDREPVESVPVEKRDVGMMFQNYALFPNMTVFDNVAFGLTVRHLASDEIRRRVGEVLELVRLTGLEGRKPHQLSGGQKQRVALARAIVIEPRVMLLDEPLSALDKALRVEMQVELRRIQREVGITTIFVTHDQEEALTLSDRIGMLRDGALVQEGAPGEIYERPSSVFAATFLGDANIFQGTAEAGGLRLADGTLLAVSDNAGAAQSQLAVRPEKMWLQRSDDTPAEGTNVIEAQVSQHIFAGSSVTYLLDWQDQTLKVFAQNRGEGVLPLGERVRICWSPAHSVPVEP
ncbi:ABC transporter ATP-binding protein [Pelagibius sp.]|uniref:ABC transporter ATP-binding protein n=1 Tax=Pelagibius sp. TaxID=1931238 RepID=UPI00261B4D18|nr:ABC transporter ATP-binding protein [Pelagibius sp.]